MTIYTQNEAMNILDMFEDVLDQYDITVPSPEDDERGEYNSARLYGSVWSDLLDSIQDAIVNIINEAKNGAEIIEYEWE